MTRSGANSLSTLLRSAWRHPAPQRVASPCSAARGVLERGVTLLRSAWRHPAPQRAASPCSAARGVTLLRSAWRRRDTWVEHPAPQPATATHLTPITRGWHLYSFLGRTLTVAPPQPHLSRAHAHSTLLRVNPLSTARLLRRISLHFASPPHLFYFSGPAPTALSACCLCGLYGHRGRTARACRPVLLRRVS